MNIKDFPDYNRIKNAILNLKKQSFKPYDKEFDNPDTFTKSIIQKLVDEIGFNITFFKPFIASEINLSFFRARPLIDFTNINLIREHSYPPLNFTRFGRCNFPQYPVFYCSPDPKISIFEVSRQYPDKTRKYVLSKWSLKKSNEQVIIQSLLSSDLPDNNLFKDLATDKFTNLNQPFETSFNEGLSREQLKGLKLLFKFLDSIFINDNDYNLSAAIAHNSLFANHMYKTDILIYPSNQSNKIGVNFALNPNFVENNLQMDRLYVVSFDSLSNDFDNMDLTIFKYGEVMNNNIIWKSPNPDDEMYKNLIKTDFGNFNFQKFTK